MKVTMIYSKFELKDMDRLLSYLYEYLSVKILDRIGIGIHIVYSFYGVFYKLQILTPSNYITRKVNELIKKWKEIYEND